jgi:membrane associated rhomboid family serine protease
MSIPPLVAPDGAAGVPVCPRHPDRESYVRCQRCDRPVCPQCQRQAAVGVQCVDCVRSNDGTPAARTVFGGRIGGEVPWITYGVIATCVVMFLLQLSGVGDTTVRFLYAPFTTRAEPWRMITSAFLHSTSFLPHILFNMYGLWQIGPVLEHLLGRARFAALYLLSAFGGSVGCFVLAGPYPNPSWVRGVVGASGALFGLFAALVLVNRRLGRDSAPIIGVIVINAILGILPNGGVSIAWQAHLGGLITGAVIAAVIVYSPRKSRSWLHPLGMAGVLLLLILIIGLKVVSLPSAMLLPTQLS